MGDMADTFNAMKSCSQDKRSSNRENSARILSENGISFESKNDGAHIIISNRWDFWPGTGKYIDRNGGKYKRGVFNLIKEINELRRTS